MKNRQIKLLRDETLRLLYLKNELKNIILKSIRINQQIKPIYKVYATYLIQKNSKFISKQKNYCLITGKSGGVYKYTNTSRQILNKLAQEGYITNIKSNNMK